MKCKLYHFLSFVLAFILFVNLQIFSFASTTGSGSASDWSGAQKADWVTNNLMWICAEGFDFVAQDTILQGVGSKVASKIEALVHDNPEYTSYDSWWERHFGFNPSPNTTPDYNKPIDENSISNVYWDQSVTNIFNEAIQETVSENPLTYKECYISSYNYLNTSQFNNYGAYKQVQEIIKNNNGYTFFVTPNGLGTQSQNNTYIVTVDVSKYPVNFIGTSTTGIFSSNVTLEHNWSTITILPQNTDGIDIYMLRNSNGHIGASAKTYQQAATNAGCSSTYIPNNATNLINNTSMFTSGRVSVFSNKSSNELIYLFANINAYKNYNSGSPQPYYFGSGYGSTTGSVNLSTSNMSNSGNYYNSVVNNIQSGWTAEQVLELVDKILSSGGGSGSGSSDSDSLDLGWLGKIGGVIVKIVNAIASVITDIIDGIANALIGEDGTGGIVGTIRSILHNVVELVTEDFNDFMSEIFGFLPPEISTILIAGITLSVFFGVIKILRK